MNIVVICPSYDESLASVNAMISRYFHPRELTSALSTKAERVTWVQGFREEGEFEVDTISLRLFIADPFTSGKQYLMSSHINTSSLTRVIERIKPDLVHITGLIPMDILQIAEVCSSFTTKLSASFHGSHPSNDPSLFALQTRALKKLFAIFFNSPERAKVWQDAGVIDSSTNIVICPETSSFFSLKDRQKIREKTGIVGNPVCVASARLHPIKDPLTLIQGFEYILKAKPDARLYWVFQTEELLSEVKGLLDASPKLKNAVQLYGPLEFEEMENFLIARISLFRPAYENMAVIPL